MSNKPKGLAEKFKKLSERLQTGYATLYTKHPNLQNVQRVGGIALILLAGTRGGIGSAFKMWATVVAANTGVAYANGSDYDQTVTEDIIPGVTVQGNAKDVRLCQYYTQKMVKLSEKMQNKPSKSKAINDVRALEMIIYEANLQKYKTKLRPVNK